MQKIKRMAVYLTQKAVELKNDQRGSLSDMTWVIGSAVVVVLIIVVFMVLAPSTAQTMWNGFVSYAKNSLGF